MKAIIVIDVDDCINVESCNSTVYVDFPFTINGWVKEYFNVAIRPMPMKRMSAVDWLHHESQTAVKTYEPSEYDKGWNDCVEFIEMGGEKND